MHHRHASIIIACALGSLAACSEPPAAPRQPTTFRVVVAESAATRILNGTMVAVPGSSRYTETSSNGATVSASVTALVLTDLDPSRAQFSIGLLGALRTGRWTVRVTGTAPRSRELYAAYLDPRAEGITRHYEVTEGVLEIDGIAPLRGRLDLRAGRFFDQTEPVVPGMTFTSRPADLTFTGVFGPPDDR